MVVQEKTKTPYSSGIYNQIVNPKESFGFMAWIPGYPHIVLQKQKNKGIALLSGFIASLVCLFFVWVPAFTGLIAKLFLSANPENLKYVTNLLSFPPSFQWATSLTIFFLIGFLIAENNRDLNSKFRNVEGDLKPSTYAASVSSAYLANVCFLFTIIFYGLFFHFVPIEKEQTIELLMKDPFVDNPPQKTPPKKPPKDAKHVATQNAVNSGRFDKKLPLSPGQSVPKPQPKSSAPAKSSAPTRPSPYQSKSTPQPSPRFSPPNPFASPKPSTSENSNKSILPVFKPKSSNDRAILSSNDDNSPAPVKPISPGSSSSTASYSSSAGKGPVLPSSPGGFSSGAGLGNAGPNNNPNGPVTVAARKDVDYGAFMQELQRRIQQAWKPANADKEDKVIISFVLKKNGSLVPSSLKTVQSSNPEAEAAARQAIFDASPGFRPLPDGAADQVRIDFTFTRTGTKFLGVKKY
ncbi:MAG: TonB C-terminal domain-containing protein [Candidatus Caenarcaniphilales bacterium]|nr:TonB C-terminal domain-containing protein [Candidatus Caenarcaniphilales bacterium]